MIDSPSTAVSPAAPPDDLDREVYCVLGLPIDAVGMAEVLRGIDAAAAGSSPFLLSTPNLNFLVTGRSDAPFRESLLLSDLCPADGMPIVWIARLTGLPIRERIAGADIFAALAARSAPVRTVYLLGGAEGVAAAAARALDAAAGALRCVGSMSPGFGSVEDMSRPEIIDAVNASHADFLAVALGAVKGQAWLVRNHDRLRIPVRAHLGATINFATGAVRRAPAMIRKLGLEWLWRIKEEPQLWRRYWRDGRVLLRLLLTRVLPLATCVRWQRRAAERRWPQLEVARARDGETLRLAGAATARHVATAVAFFREAAGRRAVIIDLTDTRVVDARFLGLLMMLRKRLRRQGASLRITGASARTTRLFRLHGAEFLLD